MSLPPKTWVEISKESLLHNLEQFERLVGEGVGVMAVVKSNAYGHGLREVVDVLKGKATWFGVDSLGEALEVKKISPSAEVLILGVTLPEWMEEAVRSDIQMTIASQDALHSVLNLSIPSKIHLKVETGTTRQGFSKEEFISALKLLKNSKNVSIKGLSTHYANIEDTTDHSYAKQQLERFIEFKEIAEQELGKEIEFTHTACSAATILFPETHFSLARVGISLYGHWSSKETLVSAKERGIHIDLKPVLNWKTRIAQIKNVKTGTPISYGMTERMSRDGKIAVLPIGYWDGYDRGLSSSGEVLIRGQRAKIIGRVCMNMCMVDVTYIPEVRSNDTVVLIGEDGGDEIAAELMAEKIGTISYEVLTRINPLIPRIVV